MPFWHVPFLSRFRFVKVILPRSNFSAACRAWFLAIAFALLSLPLSAQGKDWGLWSKWLTAKATNMHFDPLPLDDGFSGKLFEAYFEQLDPLGLIFTRQDIATLSDWKPRLDDEAQAGNDAFLTESRNLYLRCVKRADSLTAALLAQPMNWTQADRNIREKNPKTTFTENTSQLEDRWRARIKSRLLYLLFVRGQGEKPYEKGTAAELLKGEEKARNDLRQQVQRRNERRIAEADKITGETYLGAIASLYDPHTGWFSPGDKKDFSAGLSTENYSFGFTLEENQNGEVSLSKITPGGPAWKSSMLNEGDVVIAIETEARGEEEVSLYDEDEIWKILDDAGLTPVTLTVRKKNGQQEKVRLMKEKMRTGENMVKSMVLEGKTKVGYILLPAFYSQFEEEKTSGCANDIAKELVKLQKDGVQAIIIDLRHNGGGSLKEAADLAGIFIDSGPLWVDKDNHNQRRTLKDPNQGAIFTGPLLVMVNGSSASASEFLCTALQDYGRAVIAGTQTFGKGTSQIFVPLSPFSSDNAAGYLKITTDKYYRLKGNTHQLAGVTPDIVLPDPFDRWSYREEEYDNAIPADTVVKKVYYTPKQIEGLDAARQASESRMNANLRLTEIEALCQEIDEFIFDPRGAPLTPETYFQWLEKRRTLLNQLDELTEKKEGGNFTLRTSSYDQDVLAADEFTRDLQKSLHDKITSDLYIQECVEILHDLIHP